MIDHKTRTIRRMIRKPIWIGSSIAACAGERALQTRTGHGAQALGVRIDSSFATGIDLLTVSQFNEALWILVSSTGYIVRIFRTGALHWYRSSAIRNLIARSVYQITRVDLISDVAKKADAGRDCRNRLARPNFQARTRTKP